MNKARDPSPPEMSWAIEQLYDRFCRAYKAAGHSQVLLLVTEWQQLRDDNLPQQDIRRRAKANLILNIALSRFHKHHPETKSQAAHE